MKSANQNSPGADRSEGAVTASPPPRVPQIPLIVALISGALLAAAGLLVYAAMLGMMPGNPAVSQFPPAIVWLIGSVFVCAGGGIAVYQFLPRIAGCCALIALLAFVAIFNWVAFGPGERHFSKSTTTGGGSVTATKKGSASEIEGRLVFGLFAGLLDVLILYGIYGTIKVRLAKKHPIEVPKTSATDDAGHD